MAVTTDEDVDIIMNCLDTVAGTASRRRSMATEMRPSRDTIEHVISGLSKTGLSVFQNATRLLSVPSVTRRQAKQSYLLSLEMLSLAPGLPESGCLKVVGH